jgi:hypothetical protein
MVPTRPYPSERSDLIGDGTAFVVAPSIQLMTQRSTPNLRFDGVSQHASSASWRHGWRQFADKLEGASPGLSRSQ